MSEPQEFLVGGAAPEVLADVLHQVRADPEIEVVQVQGEEQAPRLLVVAMRDERSARLRTELEGRAVVEKNVRFDPNVEA